MNYVDDIIYTIAIVLVAYILDLILDRFRKND